MGWKVDQNFRTPWSVKNSLPVQVWSRANWRKAQNQKTAVSNIQKILELASAEEEMQGVPYIWSYLG